VKPFLAAVAVVVLMTGSGKAYQIVGPGVSSCATWTADRRSDSDMADLDLSWILGFLSGVGYVAAPDQDPLHGLDRAAVPAWVDRYCEAHPLDAIATAAEVFVREHPR
jgi:hypothetical protein